jgi:hypothetical protein
MIGVLILLAGVTAQTPQSPMWPNTFWQPFTETTSYILIGTHTTTGNFYYDWTTKAYRVDRANGRYDRYCGIDGPYEFQNTPCSHIVNNGNRFLYYSALNTCCYCCNSASGCGMLFPGWMTNASYIDTEVHNGVQTYKWNKPGLQSNYIYETVNSTPTNRVTVSIYQVSDDDMEFGARSTTLPNGILNLPSICSLSNLCQTGACKALRNNEGTFSSRI